MADREPSSPVFPRNAIVGTLGRLARALAVGTEVPPEFCFAAALTVIGGRCASDLRLSVGVEIEPRLFTVCLGESYDVKKSTAARRVIQYFHSRGLLGQVHVAHGVGSAEGLARELSRHPNLVLAFDELRSFVEKCRVQNSALLPMTASLFDAREWDNATKERFLSVRNARLSMLGCCTTATFQSMWTSAAIALGFPNRLFIVSAARCQKVAWPEPPDEEELLEIEHELRRQIGRLPLTLEIETDARLLWQDWYSGVPASEHAKRLDTLGLRLMPLMALTTDKDTVDLATIFHVIDILDYELQLRQWTDPLDADNTIALLEQGIRRVLGTCGPVTKRDLRRKLHADRYGLWAFDRALDNLARADDIAAEKGVYHAVRHH